MCARVCVYVPDLATMARWFLPLELLHFLCAKLHSRAKHHSPTKRCSLKWSSGVPAFRVLGLLPEKA